MSNVPGLENVHLSALSNGVTVVTELMPHVRSVSAGIWITAGSRNETAKENGISHFIEHMLFKGTANRSAEQIAMEVDSIGGNLDAFTSKELVCFNAKTLDEHLPQAFDILADLLMRPMFREDDIEKEKSVIFEELKMEVDNAEYLIHDIFAASFWNNHPLGKPILGTKKTVKSFTRRMILDYFDRTYTAGNIVITAAGNVDHESFVRLVEGQFGSLPTAGPTEPAQAETPAAELILKNKRSLEQVHFCLGVPCYSLPHARRYPMYVLNTLLGGGMSSRLFQNIREKRGLAYSVMSEQYLYRDSGCLSVYAGTSLEHTRELLRLVLEEFRSLKEQPVPADELRRAKDYMKGSYVLGLESTTSRMSHLARQQIYFRRFTQLDEIINAVEAVTPDDLQSLAIEFFRPERIAITILGRLNGLDIRREDLVC